MRLLTLLLASLVLAGCKTRGANPTDVVPVKGTLTVQGRPGEGLDLELSPATPGGTKAYARVGKGGAFVLKCLENKEGAVPGKYKVTITAPARHRAPGRAPPLKYGHWSTTDLLVEIPAGGTSTLMIGAD